MAPNMDPMWGDSDRKIVFIGCDPMDEEALRKELDDCLVPSKSSCQVCGNPWRTRFPPWTKEQTLSPA